MKARHWRNLAFQLLILVTMIVIAAINIDAYVILVAASLLVLPVINWTVTGVLLWTSKQDPTVRSLADAADNAMTYAVTSTAAAVLAGVTLARIMGLLPNQIGPVITVLIGFIVVTGSLPAFRFLQTWREVWMPMIRNSETTTYVPPVIDTIAKSDLDRF